MEKQEINKALHECKGNKSKAARMLGISRKALYKRIEESQPLTVTKGNTKNTKSYALNKYCTQKIQFFFNF